MAEGFYRHQVVLAFQTACTGYHQSVVCSEFQPAFRQAFPELMKKLTAQYSMLRTQLGISSISQNS